MSKTLKRIERGFKSIIDFHVRNVIDGIQKLIRSGKDVKQSVSKLLSDGWEDIDRRLNKPPTDSEDEFEDEIEFENNVLINYCFDEIYGPNYGIRTLLEYEEECEEGECSANIGVDRDTKSKNDTDVNILVTTSRGHNDPFEHSLAVNTTSLKKNTNEIIRQSLMHQRMPRKKREIEERQTEERYTTVRKRCRKIRRCGAQSRFDMDKIDLRRVKNGSDIDIIDSNEDIPEEQHFVAGN